MRHRKQIHPFLPPELRDRLVLHAAKKRVSQTRIVEIALKNHLDGELADRVVILRQLERLVREASNRKNDFEILSQAFGVFIRLWFAQTPRLANDVKIGAEDRAHKRYAQFAEHVSELIASGRRFAADFVAEKSDQGPGDAQHEPSS
jgi:hypothetical protein